MERRSVSLVAAGALLVLSMASCGGGGGTTTEAETIAEPTTFEETAATKSEVETSTDSSAGTVVEEGGLRKEPVVTNTSLDVSGTSGPIRYTVSAIQISKLTATSDEMASLLDVDKDKEVALVVLEASIENTSDENVTFYFGQATMTTDTKEQVDSNILLSDYIDGDYLGNVIHSGNLVYILQNSSAEDIGNIKIHVGAPRNDDFDALGDEIVIDLDVASIAN